MRWTAVLIALALCSAATAPDPLRPSHLEAIHAQRVQWMKIRRDPPLPGVYQDFRAARTGDSSVNPELMDAAKSAGVQILFTPGASSQIRGGVLTMDEPANVAIPKVAPDVEPKDRGELKRIKSEFKTYPEEVFAMAGPAALGEHRNLELRTSSMHILARRLDEDSVRAALNQGRAYTASDWLCDPAGFYFVAENTLGVYDIGDHVPLLKGEQLRVNLPIAARVVIEHGGATVMESSGRDISYPVKETGDYRLRAFLAIDGQEWLWIETAPIHIEKSPYLALPIGQLSPDVEVHRDIAYVSDGEPKHKLDLYVPKGKKDFPVMVFLHGGNWRSGDRSMYGLFGNRFALAGIGVVVPSYRLMPKDPYPAQIEDAAAAFAWTVQHISEFSGDASRIYIAGHSAGGHLAALLALDPKYLIKYGTTPSAIRGAISLSGVYDVGALPAFQNADDDPSPLHHVHMRAPRFLITYCQWDYFSLPRQARDFAAALKEDFVDTKLLYVPGESHISELVDTLKPEDATAHAILDFIK